MKIIRSIKIFLFTLIATIGNSISEKSPFLRRLINKFAINEAVNVCRHRPHPWSTVHDYVSWTSLTNKQWSARHLPAKTLKAPKDETAITALFLRESGKTRECRKSTCLFPAFAQYLTDGFIRTRMPNTSIEKDRNIENTLRKQNTSNHEIDLSPLYGRTLEQTLQLRCLTSKQGMKGKLKFQIINNEEYGPFLYEDSGDFYRIKDEFDQLDIPLGIDTYLKQKDKQRISHIFAFGGDRANASPQIALMNTLFLREHNRIAGEIEKANPAWDDERVFETARNTNIVLFIKIVIEEYINHISPIFKFTADPSVAWNASWNKPNWITTEFSLLYRWHMLIPDTMKWGNTVYSVTDTIYNNALLIGNGLKQSFVDMSEQIAGEIGPLNTSSALISLEERAIHQGRICNLASYNDYREYVHLNRLSFKKISSNKDVTKILENAYHDANDIEFYVGLFSEDVEPNSPLPDLLRTMVAVDAFSQALPNPLLSEHVWSRGADVFSKIGWESINQTKRLHDIVKRNSNSVLPDNEYIGMTRQDWHPQWF